MGIALLGIVLLPVRGMIIRGLLTPFVSVGLLVMAVASLFTRGPR